jgi:hypothetical protein
MAAARRRRAEAEQQEAPADLRTAQPEQPTGPQEGQQFNLADYGLADDEYANQLVQQLSAAEAEEDRERAESALVGYMVGRGRLTESGEARPEGVSGADEAANTANAALRSFSQWSLIPLGDQVAAGVGFARSRLNNAEGDDRSFRSYLAAEQGRRRGMQAESRGVSTVASGAGLFGGSVVRGTGSGIAKTAGLAGSGAREAAEALGRQATARVQQVTGAINRVPGIQQIGNLLNRSRPGTSRVGNVARSSAQAGLQSAAAVAAEDLSLENVPEAALMGAVVGPAGELVVRGAGRGAQAVARRFNLENSGFQALLRRLNVPPEELERRRQQFRRNTGRDPRLAELLDEDVARDSASLISPSRRASAQAQRETMAAAEDRQESLRSAIQGERRNFAPTQMAERRTRSFDNFMREAGERQVPLSDDVLELLEDADVRRLVSGNNALRRRIAEAVSGDDATGALSLQDMDTLRRLTRDAARGGGPDAARYQPVSDAFRRNAADSVPDYDQALGEFRRRRVTEEGYDLGRQVQSPSDVDEFNARLQRADQGLPGAPGRAGARVGARQSLARTASESPQAAAQTARRLEVDQGFRERLAEVFGVQDAARLTRAGAAEAQGARSLGALTPRARNTSQEDAQMVQTVIGATVAAGGRASGAMIANVGAQLAGVVSGDTARATRLANALFDPDMAPQAIRRLKQLGMRNEAIAELYREAARATGILVGREAADNDPAELLEQ